MRNKKNKIEVTMNILRELKRVSKQKVNLSKCITYFSPNTSRAQRDCFISMLGMRVLILWTITWVSHLLLERTRLKPFNTSLIGLQKG